MRFILSIAALFVSSLVIAIPPSATLLQNVECVGKLRANKRAEKNTGHTIHVAVYAKGDQTHRPFTGTKKIKGAATFSTGVTKARIKFLFTGLDLTFQESKIGGGDNVVTINTSFGFGFAGINGSMKLNLGWLDSNTRFYKGTVDHPWIQEFQDEPLEVQCHLFRVPSPEKPEKE